MLEFMFETTRSVINMILSGVLESCQNLRIIVPHGGAALPVLADRVAMLTPILGLKNPPTPEHVFALLRRFYYDLAGAPVPRLLGVLLQVTDTNHLLYARDAPFTPPALVRILLTHLQTTELLNDEVRTMMFSGNADRLLPAAF
jgi:predicted TIM-barrel fold metal-dependent hydrolase